VLDFGSAPFEVRYADELDEWLREPAQIPPGVPLRVAEASVPDLRGGPFEVVFVGTEPDPWCWGWRRPLWVDRTGQLEIQLWLGLVWHARHPDIQGEVRYGPNGERHEALHGIESTDNFELVRPSFEALLMLRERLRFDRRGAPRGYRTWHPDYFKPAFEAAWKRAAHDLKRRPLEAEVHAAMRPSIAWSTFRRRVDEVYRQRWDDLTF